MFTSIYQNNHGKLLLGNEIISRAYLDSANDPNFIWDRHIVCYYDKYITKDSTVIDIGTNFGTHSLYMSKLAKRVISIEPQRYVFNQLCGNIFINDTHNIYPYNLAVSDTPGFLKLPYPVDYSNPQNDSASLTLVKDENTDLDSIPCVKLDDFLSASDIKIDFIKIDSQGYDYLIMKGAKNTIQRDRPYLIFEVEQDIMLEKTGTKNQDFFDFLASVNYEWFNISCTTDFFAKHKENP